MDEVRQAATVLAQLGNTADEVAHSLKAQGIQGVRHTVRFLNPVVRCVRAVITGTLDMDVIEGDRLSMTLRDGRKLHVLLPPAVRAFLDAFHRGAYPDLEESQDRS